MSKALTTGVIIGRFQCHELHDGYLSLIERVFQDHLNTPYGDKFVIVIGDTPGQRTSKNPLSFELRKEIVEHDCPYPLDDILRLVDCPTDEQWSDNLDELLKDYPNPKLFGSRDSFIPFYKGKYPTVELEEEIVTCSSDTRAALKDELEHWGHFSIAAAGIIHAQENRFPTVYPTVDIAVLSIGNILLGRKPGMKKWCLVGGFIDPEDISAEHAAIRELNEEVPGLKTGYMEYVCTMKIDDWRYRGSKDGIMTTLFKTNFHEGPTKAGDDLEETKWFPLNFLNLEDIQPSHRPLIQKLRNL